MVTLYTSTGQYLMRRNDKGQKYPIVMIAGKEYHLSVSEMILWTKGMWNICSHELLKESFGNEEKILGEMNFNFVLNRLVQRGLILTGEAPTDVEALSSLISRLVVNPADVSFLSQVKMFFIMVFMLNVPIKHARTIFKKYNLTDNERLALKLAQDKHITAAELIEKLGMEENSALMLLSNLYLRKLVRFSECPTGVCL